MTLPPDYLAVQHGYALTTHKSQGMTVNHALYLTSDMSDRRSAYVAFTRSRNGGEFFVDTEKFPKLSERLEHFSAKATALNVGGLLPAIAAEDPEIPAAFERKQPGVLELLERSGPRIERPGADDLDEDDPRPEPQASTEEPALYNPKITPPERYARNAEEPQPPERLTPSDPAERDLSHKLTPTTWPGISRINGSVALPLAGYNQPAAGIQLFNPRTGEPTETKGVSGLYVTPQNPGKTAEIVICDDPLAAHAAQQADQEQAANRVYVAPPAGAGDLTPAATARFDRLLTETGAEKCIAHYSADPKNSAADQLSRHAETRQHGPELVSSLTPATRPEPRQNLSGALGELGTGKNELHEIGDLAAKAAFMLAQIVGKGLVDGAALMHSDLSGAPLPDDFGHLGAMESGGSGSDDRDIFDGVAMPANKAAAKLLKEKIMRERRSKQPAQPAQQQKKQKTSGPNRG